MVVEPGSKPQNLNAYNKLMGYTNERKGEIVYIELEPKFQSLTNVDPEKWTDDESKFFDYFIEKHQKIFNELRDTHNIMYHKIFDVVKKEYTKLTLDTVFDFAEFLSMMYRENISADEVNSKLLWLCSKFEKGKKEEWNGVTIIPDVEAEKLFPSDPRAVEKTKIFFSTLITSTNLIRYIYDDLLMYGIGQLCGIEWAPLLNKNERTFMCTFKYNIFYSKSDWF